MNKKKEPKLERGGLSEQFDEDRRGLDLTEEELNNPDKALPKEGHYAKQDRLRREREEQEKDNANID